MQDESGRKPFAAVVVDARGPEERDVLAHAQGVLARWRRSGLPVAVVCSRHGAHTLRDNDTLDIVTDTSGDREPTIDTSVRLFGEATLQMDAAPLDTLVVAHTVVGVAAACALHFRRIVGVERDGDRSGLVEAGARSVPDAMGCLQEISNWCGDRRLAVFLDYDGTLTPIVAHPADAHLAPEMREVVSRLARRFSVAVLSGRDRADVAGRVGLDHLYYAGSHGLDIAGPGTIHQAPGADAAAVQLTDSAAALEQTLRNVTGVAVERKRFSVAVHYRQVDTTHSRQVVEAVEHAASERGLRIRAGRQVRELVPDMDWHKGRALEWLRNTLEIDQARTCLVYIGDDETDEDAFRVLGPDGIGLRPGARVAASLADYHLTDVDAVRRFLQWLLSGRAA
jgi:alpha,alpha-trehalase